MIGPKRIPSWLRLSYFKAVKFTCEDCRRKEPEIKLEVHRIIQKYKGGTYRPGNCKILCRECHKRYSEKW